MAANGGNSTNCYSGLDNTINRQKMSLMEFLKIYPSLDEYSFIGYFCVIDIVTMRLLCKDTAQVFNEEILQNVIRLGNLDP